MRFRHWTLMAILSFCLTGCQPDLTGHWENASETCQKRCYATVRHHPETNKLMLMFDNEHTERAYRVESELRHLSKTQYLLIGPDGKESMMTIENEIMTTEDGNTLKKLHLRRRPCCRVI